MRFWDKCDQMTWNSYKTELPEFCCFCLSWCFCSCSWSSSWTRIHLLVSLQRLYTLGVLPPWNTVSTSLFSTTSAIACLSVGTKLGGSASGDVDMLDRIARDGARSQDSTPG